MNKLYILLITLIVLISGCTQVTEETQSLSEQKPVITTSFYPVEEITKAIVQDTAEVKVLIGTGVEPHSFEPTPSQIVELSKSDAFIVMGGMFEEVEHSIIDATSELKVIEATHNVELIKGEEHDHHDHDMHEKESHDEHEHESHEEEGDHHDGDEHNSHHEEEHESHEEDHHDEHEEEGHHDEHNHGDYDPHVWLSIHNIEAMTEEILEHLIEMYPENKELYESNAL